MLKKFLLGIIALLAPLATIAPAQADTGQPASIEVQPIKEFANGTVRFERADRPIVKRELRYVEFMPKGHAYVEFNDGSAWLFAPCEYEDSSACFWDAGFRGNRIGTSFIRYGGKTFRL